MIPVVLVHGAWGCGEIWSEVAAMLRERGMQVAAVDLPGHGPGEAASGEHGLLDCRDRVAGVLESLGRVLLVGHSMGGMVISAVAEVRPDLVARLGYVAAFLPRDGDSLLSLKRREPETIGPAVRRGPIRGTTVLDPGIAAPILFQDAIDARRARGLSLLRPQSNAVQTDPVRLTSRRFGGVPREYVLCTADRTVTPPLQRAMSSQTPVERRWQLDCGHFPQLTAAGDLAGILATMAARAG
ncbi:alpha/beta fold hydrolase [Tropicimonas sp.]|uniref:alpha/beta fold hydrolase n=1 Tax=Tropicimonas sp. TaxID=2067044 RepID=UPI003A8388D3